MKHLTTLLLTLLVLSSCATTPAQRMEANAKLDDYEICWRLAIQSEYQYGEKKLELETEGRKRQLDCTIYKDKIIADRQRQIMMGQMLYAIGGALKGETPTLGPNGNSLNISNYSSKQEGIYTNQVVSGFGKICYYNVIGTIKAVNFQSTDICPLTYEF